MLVEEIPVEYDFVQNQVPEKWESEKPDFVIHVGVSSKAEKVTLEAQAHNNGYHSPDVKNCTPQENCCVQSAPDHLQTCLDLQDLCSTVNSLSKEMNLGIETCLSTDAGHYLCDFSYYKSLFKTNGKSLFIHVPPLDKPYSSHQLTKAIQLIIQNIIKQIKP